MRWLIVTLEWLVLLPLWRAIFKPKPIQVIFASGTAFVWLIVIIVVAAVSGGGDDDDNGAATQAQPSPTVVVEESPMAEPADGEVQETPEPRPSQRLSLKSRQSSA